MEKKLSENVVFPRFYLVCGAQKSPVVPRITEPSPQALAAPCLPVTVEGLRGPIVEREVPVEAVHHSWQIGHGEMEVLGGSLPTDRKWVSETTLVISMGFLWGQVVHKHNWGELTHQHDSWVVHHQVVIIHFYDGCSTRKTIIFNRYQNIDPEVSPPQKKNIREAWVKSSNYMSQKWQSVCYVAGA